MTNSFRLNLCALTLMVSAVLSAHATDPAPTRGRILVLDNERTVEGDIERVGNQYRIRRGIGESWIPGDKALRLCANREEAYRFLKGRFNLEDPDECLRLARWCQAEGLNERALENVSVAVQLRPGHGESRRFLANLQCAAAAKPATSPPVHPSTPADTTAIPDLNNEALGLFATKVQPILMNACVSCHATGRGGTFKLTRIPLESGPANRRPLQQNLAAVLAQVNMEKPQNSPFLTKAITAHGEMARGAPFEQAEDCLLYPGRLGPHHSGGEPAPARPGLGRSGKQSETAGGARAFSLAIDRDPCVPVVSSGRTRGEAGTCGIPSCLCRGENLCSQSAHVPGQACRVPS